MSSGHNHLQLAEALAGTFTVLVPDRRGRGLSGPYPADYDIEVEVADLDAILAASGARNVVGVSSGAIIGLHAARKPGRIDRLAAFEPPLSLRRSDAQAILARLDRELAAGDITGALVTAMQGAKMGPPAVNRMPRWMLRLMTRAMLAREGQPANDGYIPFGTLAPTLHYDFALVAESSESLETFRDVSAEVLLLGGSRSPAYLLDALASLEPILPRATRVELDGLDHAASWNRDRGGDPDVVGQALRTFFGTARR
jgi:pimeloyl-ACP methyl ester carboxylesterase